MGQLFGRPQLVIRMGDDGKLVYNMRTLMEMIENGPAKKDTKVFVTCISGECGSERSFFLNLLKTYMDYYHQYNTDAGWASSAAIPIQGGKWTRRKHSVTGGVWMDIYPSLIHGKAIILLYSQGSKDLMRSTPTMDNLITFLGLQLSDVYITNVNWCLSADDLDRLGWCAYHADEDYSGALFARKMFLIWKWENSEKPWQLNELLRDASSEGLRRIWLSIQKAFKAAEVESWPHPGYAILRKYEADCVTVGDLDRQFLKEARELFHRLILTYSSDATLNCKEFILKYQLLATIDVDKINSPRGLYEQALALNERRLKAKLPEPKVAAAAVTMPYLNDQSFVIQSEDLVVSYNHELGHGASAIVYKGTYLVEPVAVKVFTEGMDLEDLLKETELKLLLTIRHPNILLTYGVAQARDELVGMVSEVATYSLWQLLFRKSTCDDMPECSIQMKRKFALEISSAVKFLHSRQIGHFDLKPSNILLVKKGDLMVAKVADLGLASYVHLFKTRTIGYQIGTLTYMAPELFHRSKPTLTCDIWSLGITLLETFTEKRPWRNKFEKIPGDIGGLFQPQGYVRKETPYSVPLLPADLQPLVKDMINYNPANRPTAADVYKYLQRVQ